MTAGTANGMPGWKPYRYRGQPMPAVPEHDPRTPRTPQAPRTPRPKRVKSVHWDWPAGKAAACLATPPADRLTGDFAAVTCGNCRKTTVFAQAHEAALAGAGQ